MLTPNIRLALTFDDVLLQPAESQVLPHQVDVGVDLWDFRPITLAEIHSHLRRRAGTRRR